MKHNCKVHGEMDPRPMGRQTNEQRWCGTWFDCPACHSSILVPSTALEVQLATQRLTLFESGHVRYALADRGLGRYAVVVGGTTVGHVTRPDKGGRTWRALDARGKHVATACTRRETARGLIRFGSSYATSQLEDGMALA